jgi:predicted dehydrogenase
VDRLMTDSTPARKLRMGMVGGGEGAFIGEVHRKAAALDGQIEFVAGALASSPEKARRSGRALGMPDDRSYPDWQAMLTGELAQPEGERIDFVSIVTPNHLHFEVAKAFVGAGIHVVCEKPMVHTAAQAAELARLVQEKGVVFAVTYNYSAYPLIRQARQMVLGGELGKIRRVSAEYHQGWLATAQDESNKQADWRTDPARSGMGGAIGDIGSHAEQLISCVTGLKLESLSADLSTFVPGRRLDDDASVLLRFVGGARGVLTCSQIEIGRENDLRLSVFGTKGSLSWQQENPNVLVVDLLDRPRQIFTRGGPGLGDEATAATRLPAGHPEAFIEAFANVYLGAAAHIRSKKSGQSESPLPYPTVQDGLQGVQFIEKVIESSRSSERWTAVNRAALEESV